MPSSSVHAHVLADRHEEDVQPFQDVLAGNEGEGSPWAYLQKTYSNTEEAVQGSSEGQDHNLLQGRAVTMPGHTISSAALPVQVSKPACLQCRHSGATLCYLRCNLRACVLSFFWNLFQTEAWLRVACWQAGGIVVHNGTSRPGVRSIVPENAWGDAAAVSGAAALSDVPNQYPPMGPSGVKCLPAQVYLRVLPHLTYVYCEDLSSTIWGAVGPRSEV